jgi:pSer/pThr/pTyr-binding forkhead associated (FHA) protein
VQHSAGLVPDPASGHALTLEAIEGPLKGQRIAVVHTSFQVGAGTDNDLRIAADQYLSNTHALFHAASGRWVLSDQGSSNGTFIDGERIAAGEHALEHGQHVRIGASEFRVVFSAGPAPPPEEPPRPPVKRSTALR